MKTAAKQVLVLFGAALLAVSGVACGPTPSKDAELQTKNAPEKAGLLATPQHKASTSTTYKPTTTTVVVTTTTTQPAPTTTRPPAVATTQRQYVAPTTAVTSPPQSNGAPCHPSYTPCIPDEGTDVDCAGGGGDGPRYVQGPVSVHGPDEYKLDRDGDGVACDT